MFDPNTLTTTVTAIGIAIAEGKTAEEIAVLSAAFMQLSDVLNTISAQRALIEAKYPKTNNNEQITDNK